MNEAAQMTSPAQPDAAQPRSKFFHALAHPAFICTLLAAAASLAFWPVHRFDFLNYDDHDYVTANSHVQTGFTKQNIIWAFREGHSANWHPLTWISHMADVQLFGKTATAPHVV